MSLDRRTMLTRVFTELPDKISGLEEREQRLLTKTSFSAHACPESNQAFQRRDAQLSGMRSVLALVERDAREAAAETAPRFGTNVLKSVGAIPSTCTASKAPRVGTECSYLLRATMFLMICCCWA